MSQQYIPTQPTSVEPQQASPKPRRRWPWIIALAVVAPFSFVTGLVAGEDVGYEAALDDVKAEAADTRPGTTAAVEPTSEPDDVRNTAPPTEEPPAEPVDEPAPDYGNFTDNNVFEWEDGLVVTVAGLEEFTPSDTAAFDDSPAYVRFTVTITNNTGAEYEPLDFWTTMQSGGAEATSVFDEGLDGSPSTTLLDGRDVSFGVGYGVDDAADLVLEVSPSFEHDPAIFTTE